MTKVASAESAGLSRALSRRLLLGSMAAAGAVAVGPRFAAADAQMDADALATLKKLYASNEGARVLGEKAKGILVFPTIAKGGFMIGGAYGEGTLLVNGRTAGYYSSAAASYGLQIGIQRFSYALFMMTDSAMQYLNKSDGWEIGVGPTIVVADEGFATKATTTTLKAEIYAFIFGQQGLMAGLGIEGTKVTRINR
ncbi:lipoprotein [Hypericibacter terrae]|jgi:lipid-binding SYLF domain-containing protein|uniref:Lipoprotein n=1 Tax=Hypericibacter terrae TaxID=2602015 RepID=A0A5J6MHI8_9PROT|nr:lipid-binding SYLF domain-containing protein [Hypericibacter terrae]QEX16587.1 lipoprotein [Hypericibacter terrae]